MVLLHRVKPTPASDYRSVKAGRKNQNSSSSLLGIPDCIYLCMYVYMYIYVYYDSRSCHVGGGRVTHVHFDMASSIQSTLYYIRQYTYGKYKAFYLEQAPRLV